MNIRINWGVVIPTGVFIFTLWLLQSALSTLYKAVEAGCGDFSCPDGISTAYSVLSLSTVVSALGIAWVSYRFNTSLYKGKE